MKRFICLLLAMVSLLGLLCGCGKDNNVLDLEEKVKESLKSVEWTDGKIADGVYTNESLNMTFQIPEGWIQASEEEGRSILNIDANDGSTICDVLLGTRDTQAFMAVICFDLRKQIGGASMTEDDFLKLTLEEEPDSVETTDATFNEIQSVSICGREYRGLFDARSMGGNGTVSYIQHSWILLSRLGKDKMVMLAIRAPETDLDYYMAHFTDDPSTIPDPPVEATPEPVAVFTRGERNDSSYTSAFTGLRFDAPEGWRFDTDQELVEFMNLDPDELGEAVFNDADALAELFSEQTTIYDMIARAPDSATVIQLGLDNLSSYIGGTFLSATEYAEIVAEQLETTGYSYEIGELEQQELAGKNFVVVPAVMKDYGIYQYLYIARVENYMLAITLTGTDNSVRDYADYFSEF